MQREAPRSSSAGARRDTSDAWGRIKARSPVDELLAASRPRVETSVSPRGVRGARELGGRVTRIARRPAAPARACSSREAVHRLCTNEGRREALASFSSGQSGNGRFAGVRLSGTLRRGHGPARPGGVGGTVASIFFGVSLCPGPQLWSNPVRCACVCICRDAIVARGVGNSRQAFRGLLARASGRFGWPRSKLRHVAAGS